MKAFLAFLAGLLIGNFSVCAYAQDARCPNYSMHSRQLASTVTAYTINSGTDQCRTIVSTTGSAATMTLPKPGALYPRGFAFWMFTSGAGTVTLTAATGTTINGGSTVSKAQGTGAYCSNDGAAWFCVP